MSLFGTSLASTTTKSSVETTNPLPAGISIALPSRSKPSLLTAKTADLFFSIASTTRSSSLIITVCIVVLPSICWIFSTVCLITRLTGVVKEEGACCIRVTVVIPVAIEVTKLKSTASNISWGLFKSLMSIF